MIHFDRTDPPDGFADNVTTPGNDWLAANPNAKRPRDLWSPYKGNLQDAFRSLCAYCAMYEPVGTVDHFISCNNDMSKAYDWDNYRFASGWINSSKKKIDDLILDPFEVLDGWFEIILPSCQLVLTDQVPDELREKAEYTLKRLHLIHDERVVRQRRRWIDEYEKCGKNLGLLERNAPLLAEAIRKQAMSAVTSTDGEA